MNANQVNWKIGDRFYIYEDGRKLWGKLIEDRGHDEFFIKWDDNTETVQKPSPASDWLRQNKHKIKASADQTT